MTIFHRIGATIILYFRPALRVLKRHIFTAILPWIFFTAAAQSSQVHFENISAQHGDLNNKVNDMIEDHLGFLWFATNVGLFRYDGYELKGYYHDVFDTTTISTHEVHFVTEDHQGDIWVSTVYGIDKLDRRSSTFKRFHPNPIKRKIKGSNNIRQLLVDRDDRLIALGSEKLFLFDKEQELFKQVFQKDDRTATHRAVDIVALDDGTVWCAANDGLLRLLPGDTVFTHVIPRLADKSQYTGPLYSIAAKEDNTLWLGDSGGLAHFNPSSGVLHTDWLPQVETRIINELNTTKDGGLWLSLSRGGVGRLEPDGSYTYFEHDDNNFRSLNDDLVNKVLEDKFGNTWLATGAGIAKISVVHPGFQHIQNVNGINQMANWVMRVHKDRNGMLWTRTQAGLYRGSAYGGLSNLIKILPTNVGTELGYWLYEDSTGDIWVPIDNHGIWKKEFDQSNFRKVPLEEKLSSVKVFKIIEDNSNKNLLWLGTTAGLCALDKKTLETKWFAPKEQYPEIRSNDMVVFEQDGDAIWFYYTYFNTLGKFNKKSGLFEIIHIPPEDQRVLEGVVRDIAISKDQQVWLATGFGLTRYNIQNNSFHIYTDHHGLIENSLNAVLVDKKQMVWATGTQYVSQFNPITNIFTSYKTDEIKKYAGRSKFLDQDGRIYFGGQNGIYTFHPDSIARDFQAPRVVLTDFKVQDSTYLLDKAFEFTREIILSYKQNDIAFEFSGIYLVDQDENTYRCKLEGYDNTWRELGFRRSVNYTNLNPGNYTFKVLAANKYGVWSDEDLSIDLLITPPFTQTNWFRMMVALVLALLLYAIFKIYQYQQTLRKEKQIAEKTARYRQEFLAHASHEIRTPMNAIIGLSELAKETDLDPHQQKYVSAIQRSSQNLLSIINELLDHSKLESGMFTFRKEEFSLNDVTAQTNALFITLADEKRLEFQTNIAPNVPRLLIGDGLRLSQILTNLIGNAIKYTESGAIHLDITVKESSGDDIVLLLEVSDTGIGIQKDKLEKVFDRFTDDAHGMIAKGTGLGLYITREFVQRQGGRIEIQSELNNGTTVFVHMPFKIVNEKTKEIPKTTEEHLFGPLNILLVDDAPLNHLVVTEMLKKRIPQAHVISAYDGQEALDQLQQEVFDVIIMDAKMPGIDGLEVTRQIRQMNGSLQGIPILGATAGAMPEQLQECLDSGMNDVITKPIKINELIDRLFQLTRS